MTSLTFYGGVNEIGGNKILLEDKDTKIFLDFGMSFGRNGMYFDKFMKPRTSTGIKDFMEMGLIPNLEGIYRDDLMEMENHKLVEPNVNGVLLTHAHADHVNYISFLHEKIPIYMGETCHNILEAIKEKSVRSIDNEILSYKPKNEQNTDEIQREIHTFRTGEKFDVGSIGVEPIHVDHSIPGAYGFILHTSSGAIVYTGDVRFHGTKPEMTEEFVKKSKKADPVALITEGTRVNDLESDESEQKVHDDCDRKIKSFKNLVIADFSIKDVDRFRTFYKIAKENDRKYVISVSDMPLLKYLESDPNLNMPGPKDKHIVIFKPKKSVYRKYEQEFFEQDNVVTAEDISKNMGKYLCAFNFWDFGALIDMQPNSTSLYIRSSSEPYTEEMEIDEQRINNWLQHFGFERFQSHCSGHSKGSEILGLVQEIGAKTVFPVHTEHPDVFKKVSKNRVLIDEGKKYNV